MSKTHVAYVIDPRFPGGTSSAVAAEIGVVAQFAKVSVHGVTTSMFMGHEVSPVLQATLHRLGLEIVWDAPTISADVVLFHNPSCLKFQNQISTRIITPHLIVIAHENFLRPSGAEAFDVALCMDQISRCSVAFQMSLAPISEWNRDTITRWKEAHGGLAEWSILDRDWFNICDFPITEPRSKISDLRGRLSRPGFEKFPQNDVMELCFPEHAEGNIILGADALMADPLVPLHWTLHPFRALPVSRFFDLIDFMIYFTAPTFRESFGRVMAEAIAAGKIVITDPDTAKIFKGAVIAAQPADVDGIIQDYLADPAKYVSDVRAAQTVLSQFSPQAFEREIGPILTHSKRRAA